MSASNFKTENNTYRKLIGNGLSYRIPRFQRDYSWTETEWDDLWNDISNTIQESEPAHYMGYLVLQSDNDKQFDVIDGQQRLTTLSLVVLATLKNLKNLVDLQKRSEDNQKRIDQIRSTYIGYLDPVSLVPKSKLTLNRNNDHYFQTYLVPLQQLPQRGFKASEHALRKAFEWFDKKIQSIVKSSDDPGKQLAEFVENMSDKLFFTVINVTDELNAYKVFETLNACGVRLSSTDLLKNYLFSVLSRNKDDENELKALDDRWEKIVSRLGAESFPDFVRTHWNSHKNFVRASDLFKTVRGKVTTREQVFTLLREMDEDVDTYLALTQPEGASNWSTKLKKYAKELKMFKVRQPFPLLLAAKRNFEENEFQNILRGCVVAAFRYNVIGNLPTNEQEPVYFSIAKDINEKKITNSTEVLQSLKSIYPSDESFKQSFSEKIIKTTDSRNNKLVRYILCELEYQDNQQDHDIDSDSFTIEHVLPQNPENGWNQFTDEQVDNFVYRIGNMALLEKGKNNEIANHEYIEKSNSYKNSTFGLTRKIAETWSEWTVGKIESRQKELAKLALTIWRISQLDDKS